MPPSPSRTITGPEDESLKTTSTARKDLHTFEFVYRAGDIFADAPPGTLFIHSCNARGIWGKGIAAQFRSRYPKAFNVYRAYCKATPMQQIIGKCRLIEPQIERRTCYIADRHWIACLMVRETYGRPTAAEKADGYEDVVLTNTCSAFRHLIATLQGKIESGELPQDEITEIRMPLINSGLFGIPWEDTAESLQSEIWSSELAPVLRKIYVYEG